MTILIWSEPYETTLGTMISTRFVFCRRDASIRVLEVSVRPHYQIEVALHFDVGLNGHAMHIALQQGD